jgi:hypothetical protein
MSLLPDVISSSRIDAPASRQEQAAARAQRSTELEVLRHGLAARSRAECDRLDSQAAGDALRAALDEELGLLDYGMQRAGGSPAKAELVARKVEMLAGMNNRRALRRFGG